ncbi:MAG: 4'-phosphopantetheinyl transferase superfamily protein [Betaproteobacteria bacterium]|nr:4'-phosphopantetheinyl transferase superfamily protein [Betaproteobacteria bacterium]
MSLPVYVDVVFADLPSLDLDHVQSQLLPRLSLEDRRRYASIRRPLRQKQFLAGRLLALEGEWRGLGPASFGAQLPPALNISHSGQWAACAFASQGTVGCDLERIGPRAVEALAEVVCSPDEQALLTRSVGADRKQLFYRYWTVKEAMSKTCRQGLALDLRTIELSLEPGALFYPSGITPESALAGVSALLLPDLAAAVMLSAVQAREAQWRWWRHTARAGEWLPTPPLEATVLIGRERLARVALAT